MRIVEAIIQAMYYEICIVINARSIKAHYGLGTKNYRMNKQRARDTSDNPHDNPTHYARHQSSRKQPQKTRLISRFTGCFCVAPGVLITSRVRS